MSEEDFYTMDEIRGGGGFRQFWFNLRHRDVKMCGCGRYLPLVAIGPAYGTPFYAKCEWCRDWWKRNDEAAIERARAKARALNEARAAQQQLADGEVSSLAQHWPG